MGLGRDKVLRKRFLRPVPFRRKPLPHFSTSSPGPSPRSFNGGYFELEDKTTYLLLTEFEVRIVSYGPSFFPFDL